MDVRAGQGWTTKNWCFQTVVPEKTLESPLDSREIKPVHPKGNEPWIFIGSTDAEAPILWPPDAKSWLTGKDHDAEKDWGQEEKRVIEDKMVGRYHQLNGQTPLSLRKLQEIMKDREAWRLWVQNHNVISALWKIILLVSWFTDVSIQSKFPSSQKDNSDTGLGDISIPVWPYLT